jgi:hypothetical protein
MYHEFMKSVSNKMPGGSQGTAGRWDFLTNPRARSYLRGCGPGHPPARHRVHGRHNREGSPSDRLPSWSKRATACASEKGGEIATRWCRSFRSVIRSSRSER